jgi:hypothetical protein
VSTVDDDASVVESVKVADVANVEVPPRDDEPKEVQDDTGYESGQSAKVISDNVVSSSDAC